MSTAVTKKDVQEIVEASVSKAVDDLSGIIAGLAQDMHTEIGGLKTEIIGIHGSIGRLEDEVNKIKIDIKDIKSSIDRLTNTIDAFVSRLDANDVEMAARDAQFERLLQWAREVSVKTGIPLKNL